MTVDKVSSSSQKLDVPSSGLFIEYLIKDTSTEVGNLLYIASPKGVIQISLNDEDFEEDLRGLSLLPGVSLKENKNNRFIEKTLFQFDEYFSGKRKEFSIEIDQILSKGFRRKAQTAMLKIPYGKVASYKKLAELSESPKAFQAVGSACSTNPLPIILPCHRVIKNDGSLGNYGGGIRMKKFLLELEGIDLVDSNIPQENILK